MNTNPEENKEEKSLQIKEIPSPEGENPKKLKYKYLWILLAIVSFIYIFIPEITDTIPFLGWIDEGIAIYLLSYSLQKLGIRIPLLDKILTRKKKLTSRINRNIFFM